MSTLSANNAQLRANLYQLLAEALTGPTPAGALIAALRASAKALDSAACRLALFALAEQLPAAHAGLASRYHALWATPGRPPAFNESLALGGHLIGPPTGQVAAIYRSFGLDAAGGDLPDSAGVELAFLGYLAKAEAQRAGDPIQAARWRHEQRRFLEAHVLTWIPRLGLSLARAGDPFYGPLGQFLADFLAEESGRLRPAPTGTGAGRLPALTDPRGCTLCGFCVQDCPAQALRIVETADATHLLLTPRQCSGCGRCVRTCPEDALHLSGSEAVGQAISLRHSPRARCPGCGRPTVSQAELAAVSARLDANETLQHRLSLCPTCKSR